MLDGLSAWAVWASAVITLLAVSGCPLLLSAPGTPACQLEFPVGTMDQTESPEAAARRELEGQTGWPQACGARYGCRCDIE